MLADFKRAVSLFGFSGRGDRASVRAFHPIGTGALVGGSSVEPGFYLTARHHFLFGGTGVRLGDYETFEAIWDYGECRKLGCSPEESLNGLPRSRGATLVASDPATDSALMRLEEVPPGRTFLGWSKSPAQEEQLHRLSHPYGMPQTYASHFGLEPFEPQSASRCVGAPAPSSCPKRFYQTRFEGLLGPGSSGAPLVTSDLRLVGQLWGVYEKKGIPYALDGAFLHAYEHFRLWLDPLGRGEAPPWRPS